jgi:hypothetical protein
MIMRAGFTECARHEQSAGKNRVVTPWCGMNVTPLLLVPALLIITPLITTPARAATQDVQSWNIVSVTVAASKKLSIRAEGQLRLTDNLRRHGTSVARAALEYRIDPHVGLVLGYTHLEMRPLTGRRGHEDNIYQQVNISPRAIGRVHLRLRTWVEERWSSNGSDVAIRFRQRVRAEVPLKHSPVTLFASTEAFAALNSTDWGIRRGFDQVRNIVGVNVRLSSHATLEAGYMNRYQVRYGIPDRDDHIFPLALAFRF